MPPPSDIPLQKVTLNLFRDDVTALTKIYGNGWTGEIRLLVANHVLEHKTMAKNLTFGGFDGD